MSLRARDIPLGITILAVLLGLFATAIGVAALFNPSLSIGYVTGAHDLGTTWAGRNAGLGVVLLVAVLLRNGCAYAAAFAGQFLREVSDLVAGWPSVGGIVGVLPFLVVDVLGLMFALRAVQRDRARVGAALR